jgi:DNA-binding GntR family transcriptional regulator
MRSRTPVRHALTQLVAKGFLEKKKKKGYYIPYPSKEDARHVFFAREHIESINAESAALNRSEEDLQKTRTLIENEAETGREGRKNVYSAINESFHLMIAKMSSNPYLEQYSRHLFWRSSFYIFYFGSYYTEKDYINYMLAPPEHQAILDAIETRDAPRAVISHVKQVARNAWSTGC